MKGGEVEFLIVGQGLAGTTLAWELLRRGCEPLVIDADEPVTSSKIAAGLITPITGQRMALSWRANETLEEARAFYRHIAAQLGRAYFHERPVLRVFCDDREADLWHRRTRDAAFVPFIAQSWPEHGRYGAGEIRGGGYLDCAGYLGASRDFFRRRGLFEVRRIDPAETAKFPAGWVIFCQGFAAAQNPFFSWVPWKAAKGEILTLRIGQLAGEERIVTAGQWLLPMGGGVFRTGSTYEWHQLDNRPTATARELLERGLRRLTPHSFEVIEHKAAVRPIIHESKALVGVHPVYHRLAFFNGLGSKGALHAPFFARHLAEHLLEGHPIEEELDLRRNL
ncbi:MAG: NAD(P)/FAD-dependent oxidoreductase [Verrucomicrobiales bacterium]